MKILLVAYHFPPAGGAGVHRSLGLANYLSEEHEVDVLTPQLKEDEVGRDRLSKLGDKVGLLRSPDPFDESKVNRWRKLKLGRVHWMLFYPRYWERQYQWAKYATDHLYDFVHPEDYDVVYTSSGPYSSMLVGEAMQQKGVKWVADWRDPYTDAYGWHFPTYFHWLGRRRWERRMLEKPDTLIVNTEEVKKLFVSRGIRLGKRMVVINNGVFKE